MDATIAQAFQLYSDVIPLNFKQVYSGTADIMILFKGGCESGLNRRFLNTSSTSASKENIKSRAHSQTCGGQTDKQTDIALPRVTLLMRVKVKNKIRCRAMFVRLV